MKRAICAFAALVLVLGVLLTGCGKGGGQLEGSTEPRTTTFEEKRSYYDQLAKGEIEVEIETTAVKGAYYSFVGDTALLPDDVLHALNGKVRGVYERIYSAYGPSFNIPKVTISVESGYTRSDSNYAVGTTVYVNPGWFAENPKKVSEIIYGLVQTMQTYHGDYPEWLKKAIQYYIRAAYDPGTPENPFVLPVSYNGKSYEEDPMSAAAFLKWVDSFSEGDLVQRLNRALQNGSYKASFWSTETGLSFDKLWASYKTNSDISAE